MPVERAELLALMDLNMREMYREDARVTAGGFVVERDGLVMCATPHGTPFTNMVMVAEPVRAAVVRDVARAVFEPAGLPWSVWTRAHADAAVDADLRAAGFRELMDVPGMVFAPQAGAPAPCPPDLDVRVVADDGDRAAYAGIMTGAWSVYGVPPETIAARFAAIAGLRGPTTTAFVARREGVPVAGAMLYLSHGVGGIGWVGTTPDAFGRGHGTAVTWAVVAEGLRRGARFLSLQASPLGAPVYRRMGFATPTSYRVFLAPD